MSSEKYDKLRSDMFESDRSVVAQNKAAEALSYAERARAGVLLDVLHSGKTNISNAMSVLLRLPTRKDSAPATLRYFKSAGFEGLMLGDKVVVFVNEYDGGCGIIEAAGSNRKLGIKLRNWSDAVIGAIDVIAGDAQMATRPSERMACFANRST